MILLGYTLHLWLDPLLKPVFGPEFQIAKQIDKVIIVVVLAVGAADRRQGRQGVAGEAQGGWAIG